MLSTLDVARSAGLELHQRGGKHWACCPFHNERTPSFAIYPDGRGWYCFSCHRGGDAAALYQQLYGVPIGDALRAVGKDEATLAPVRSAGEELRRKVERWRDARWDAACRELHASNAALEEHTHDDAALWDTVERRERAAWMLDTLENASPRDLVAMLNDERTLPADAKQRMGRAGSRAGGASRPDASPAPLGKSAEKPRASSP